MSYERTIIDDEAQMVRYDKVFGDRPFNGVAVAKLTSRDNIPRSITLMPSLTSFHVGIAFECDERLCAQVGDIYKQALEGDPDNPVILTDYKSLMVEFVEEWRRVEDMVPQMLLLIRKKIWAGMSPDIHVAVMAMPNEDGSVLPIALLTCVKQAPPIEYPALNTAALWWFRTQCDSKLREFLVPKDQTKASDGSSVKMVLN